MSYLYNIATYLAKAGLWMAQFFSPKLRKFVQGRKHTFKRLASEIMPSDQVIWFHCASLGEFEQGVPIMNAIRANYPFHKILVSFFSPSGYEVKKDSPLADVVVYLPMDTHSNAKKFIHLAHPVLSIFVKYEFWPHYLFELDKQQIPSLLVSGLFRKEQMFFQWYGRFMRKALATFQHIFVQNNPSEALIKELGITNVSVSGDTRFDRVSHQIEQDNTVEVMDTFIGESLCVVCGSTWPEDEAVLLPYINSAPDHIKFVVAPHQINDQKIEHFEQQLKKPSKRYSQHKGNSLSETRVFIIDTIGLLTKIYSYADIAYVGGAVGSTGLHNILEPATFGIPIVIGQHYDNFPEAVRLRSLAGLFSVKNATEASEILAKLADDHDFRSTSGMIAGHFVNRNTGATDLVMERIKNILPYTETA